MFRPHRVLYPLILAVLIPTTARAQQPGHVDAFSGPGSIYGAPGWYGVSWGTPSYGVGRKFTEFSSPYGAGYGYGYVRPAIMPGPYGQGIWNPGGSTVYGYGRTEAYRTFPATSWPRAVPYGPPVGVYAPAFGPSMWPAW
jgi:hypothetical protein